MGELAGADMTSSSRIIDEAIMVLAVVFGAGSLVLFAPWPFDAVRLGLGERGTLLWDGALSLAFFLQHSVMVRTPVKRRLGRLFPERYVAAAYAIASGVVLTLVLVLWQRSPTVALAVEGPLRWLLRALAVLALAGLVWGGRSLRGFDPLGLRPIKAHLRGRPRRDPPFVVRGAYRWVRHPLYSSIILLFWSEPVVTSDRLLFDALWTAWIVVGTVLEERDLAAELGEPYLDYRRKVPMLVPWHAPRA